MEKNTQTIKAGSANASVWLAGILLLAALGCNTLQRAIQPNNAETYFNNGKAYADEGDYDRAIA